MRSSLEAKDQACCECGVGSVSGPGTSPCNGCGKKKKKNRRRRRFVKIMRVTREEILDKGNIQTKKE